MKEKHASDSDSPANTRLSPEAADALATIETDKERLPSGAAALHEIIRYEGIKALERDSASLLFSAMAAGLSMGASMVAKTILDVYLPDNELRFLMANLGYTVGFVFVILAQQQLFTETTVTAVLPFMSHPSLLNLARVLRMWALVLMGNLVGTALFALALYCMPAFPVEVHTAFPLLGREMMQNTGGEMFFKGIFAGWLIATLVWMLPAVGKNKLAIIILVTYMIGIGGFTHIIVGSAEVLYLVFNGEIDFSAYLYPFALPTLLGNIIGGTFIFALISHAQIRSDMPGHKFG